MAEHRPAVANVFREFAAEYLAKYGQTAAAERQVLHAITACKTAALGGHKAKCSACEHEAFFYNSCRDRHCPRCQGQARAKWLEKRSSELLETPYFHVVFTLPEGLAPIALNNKRVLYEVLFRAASETLLKVARNPKHLGAEIGVLAVLHTWGQTLNHHPHVHCVVPGGGLSRDKSRWVRGRGSFFLPVRVLSRVFRGKFLNYLRDAYDAGELETPGKARAPGSEGQVGPVRAGGVEDGVGRLLEAPLRRPEAGPQVPGSLHPPGRDLRPAAGGDRGWQGHLPVQGLPRGQERAHDDARRHGVHASLLPARAPEVVPPASATTASSRIATAGRTSTSQGSSWAPSRKKRRPPSKLKLPLPGKTARCSTSRRSRSVPCASKVAWSSSRPWHLIEDVLAAFLAVVYADTS